MLSLQLLSAAPVARMIDKPLLLLAKCHFGALSE